MKKIKTYIILICALIVIGACSDLDTNPQGILREEQVKTPENIEGLVISAYSSLGNDHYTAPHFFGLQEIYGLAMRIKAVTVAVIFSRITHCQSTSP